MLGLTCCRCTAYCLKPTLGGGGGGGGGVLGLNSVGE